MEIADEASLWRGLATAHEGLAVDGREETHALFWEDGHPAHRADAVAPVIQNRSVCVPPFGKSGGVGPQARVGSGRGEQASTRLG